jgi:hypothetical protein
MNLPLYVFVPRVLLVRSFMQQLMYSVLEHLGSSLSTAFAVLPSAAVAAPAAAAGCPVESLAQYFMDLVYVDAVLSKAGER